ncbi:carboxymuconolactone decarboxylase family protein [Sulfuritalea sp.]|uniref:carboxymuconolactone decarboxylase family protein n=1 Tax=Sulfuritalea sp. TaxID=2480090 RepID=UPI001AC98235|nr:carboxymuconolactone decarboxylase family protein [Sulfuritalea sp.]MBN8474352.1 carboxymuconolactone decarboxylase family protein [Sulfuritalea sp.]
MDHTISGAGFRRRIYSSPLHFLRDLGRVVGVFGSVLALSMKGGISAGFRERLMLVVTAVNRCRHCAWGHQIFARHAGLSQAEIAALLMLDLGSCPAAELPGLRYAIHGAERDGQPTTEARAFLDATYGAVVARQIDTACLLIQVGNRVGNTGDFLLCWLSRGRFGLLPEER